MTITRILVCCREDALGHFKRLTSLKQQGEEIVWIHVTNHRGTPLFPKSTKTKLIVKFNDISVTPSPRDTPDLFSKKQAQKIRRFLCNWEHNKQQKVTVLVNCNAGISRSPAIGEWCATRFGAHVTFLESLVYPNTRVLGLLGMPPRW